MIDSEKMSRGYEAELIKQVPQFKKILEGEEGWEEQIESSIGFTIDSSNKKQEEDLEGSQITDLEPTRPNIDK